VNYPGSNRGSTTQLPMDFIVPSGGGYSFMPSVSTFKTHFGE
jgi:hypothetical protein